MEKDNKYKIWFLSLIIVFVVILIGLYIRQQEMMKTYGLLHDRMSYPILYALNNGKISEAKRMLSYNLVNLVLHYDKDILLNSKSLSNFCNEWNDDIKNMVLNIIEQQSFNDTAYKDTVTKNIDLINVDCKR